MFQFQFLYIKLCDFAGKSLYKYFKTVLRIWIQTFPDSGSGSRPSSPRIGLHVYTAAYWLRPYNPPSPLEIWTHIRGRYWSAKIATSLCDPLHPALEKNTHHPTLQNPKLSGAILEFPVLHWSPIESRSGPESSATIVPRMFYLLCSAPMSISDYLHSEI
jgi:hypothetical protein